MKFSVENIKSLLEDELKVHEKEYQMDLHFNIVKKYADKLAKIYNADKEVIETAVWLHDIDRIGELKEDHNITGAERAGNLLKKMNYPEDLISKVKHCILTHRCMEGDPAPHSIEAKILASADAMAHFDVIPLMMWMAGKQSDMKAKEAARWLYKKIERDWNRKMLLPEAREMVKNKHLAFKILFKDVI